ncbi:MAG TPA: CHAD domain-containing protein, partial [Anaeromyxobacteraceae bacterium]|nr:CHAD domain-containing protein [Anaeromyxobacteraceae bacterium]
AGPLLVAARLADVRRHEAGVAKRLDHDAVHDMRVATRRLRAALKLFAAPRALDRDVKRLQDALGDVRDVQVQLAWLAETDERLRGPERARMRAWIAAPLDRHVAALRDALAAWSRDTAPEAETAARAVTGRRPLGGKKMRKELARRTRRVARLAARARADPAPRTAHELRIAAKKLRYTAELLEAGLPGEVGALLSALVPLQETLGALHDADVRVERLGRLAEEGEALERRAAARLLELLAPERERLAAELVAELETLGTLSA